MFTSRHLKRKRPDRDKIKQLFADKGDDVLHSALANPDHSEEARQILKELADRRGLQVHEDLWDLSQSSVYVKPFGARPSFEEALAAPRRRRRLYRITQAVVIVSLALGVAALIYSVETYEGWVQEGVASGVLDAELTKGLGTDRTNEEVYHLSREFGPFAERLRSTYYGMVIDDLVTDGSLNGGEVDRLLAEGQSHEQISDLIDATVGVPSELVSAAKARAWSANLQGSISDGNDEFDALVRALETAWTKDNVAAQDRFDYFAGYLPFEPDGARTPFASELAVPLILLAILAWVIAGIFAWTRPYRVLLLRPFQSKAVSRSLKRFVNKNVAFNGHTFTLADEFVKESRIGFLSTFIPRGPEDIVVIPLFFIPPVRQFKRWLNVTSARNYRFLQKRLRRRFTLNMFWLSSYTKILKVKSSDAWWKACVDLLMFSSQLIVVDLSWVKQGTEWELEKINTRDLENKSVFIVAEDNVGHAREMITKFWPAAAGDAPPELHVYRKSGKLLDREAYERDVARTITESHLWDERPAPPHTGAHVA